MSCNHFNSPKHFNTTNRCENNTNQDLIHHDLETLDTSVNIQVDISNTISNNLKLLASAMATSQNLIHTDLGTLNTSVNNFVSTGSTTTGSVSLLAGTANIGKVGLLEGTANIGKVGLLEGTANIGTVGLLEGNANIGKVGLLAGTANIGTVGLQAGTAVGLLAGTAVGLQAGTAVGLLAGSANIGTVGLQAGTAVGLQAGTANIGTVGLQAGTAVGLQAGTAVGLQAGTAVGLLEGTTVGLLALKDSVLTPLKLDVDEQLLTNSVLRGSYPSEGNFLKSFIQTDPSGKLNVNVLTAPKLTAQDTNNITQVLSCDPSGNLNVNAKLTAEGPNSTTPTVKCDGYGMLNVNSYIAPGGSVSIKGTYALDYTQKFIQTDSSGNLNVNVVSTLPKGNITRQYILNNTASPSTDLTSISISNNNNNNSFKFYITQINCYNSGANTVFFKFYNTTTISADTHGIIIPVQGGQYLSQNLFNCSYFSRETNIYARVNSLIDSTNGTAPAGSFYVSFQYIEL